MGGQRKHSKNKTNHNKGNHHSQGESKSKQQKQQQKQKQQEQQQEEEDQQSTTSVAQKVTGNGTEGTVSSSSSTSGAGGVARAGTEARASKQETFHQMEDAFRKLNNLHSTHVAHPSNLVIPPRKRRKLNSLVMDLQSLAFLKVESSKEKWDVFLKMQNILKRIADIEEPLNPFKKSASSGKRVDKIDNLYKWVKENGVEYNGIEICEFPGYGLGLRATKPMKKNDEIFSIPQHLILTENIVHDVRLTKNMANVRLFYALMLEFIKPDSFWRPYIDLLPTEYNTCLYYTQEEMEMLKGSSILPSILNQCRAIARQYGLFYHMINNVKGQPNTKPISILLKEKFCYALCKWAVSTVMTRQNILPDFTKKEGEEPDKIAALIPFWDLANHRRGEITSFFCASDCKMISSAQEDYEPGDQIFIHYGNRSNADYLLHNAFIDENNPDDYVVIRLGLSPTDPLYPNRLVLLELLKIAVNHELKVLPSPNFISPELLAYVRVFNMNGPQLKHWIESGRSLDLLHMDCALDTDLENKTWTYIQNRLMILLRSYATTLQDDEEKLKKYKNSELTLTPIAALLLYFLWNEKRTLTEALEYAKQKIKA